jgi:hypothetical protein
MRFSVEDCKEEKSLQVSRKNILNHDLLAKPRYLFMGFCLPSCLWDALLYEVM